MRILPVFAFVAALAGLSAVAGAQPPTAAQCDARYNACDAKCKAEDPKRSFSYATCSAACVAKKGACDSEIIYDKSANWTKKQYDAAKPWVEEKIDNAPANTEYTYPNQNRDDSSSALKKK